MSKGGWGMRFEVIERDGEHMLCATIPWWAVPAVLLDYIRDTYEVRWMQWPWVVAAILWTWLRILPRWEHFVSEFDSQKWGG